MRIWGLMLYWLLPFAAHGWWCETSAVTGCVGHPRHFVLETSSADAFQKFEQKFEAGIGRENWPGGSEKTDRFARGFSCCKYIVLS